jgi:hypothetical protein
MNRDQVLGMCLGGCFCCYIVLDSLGKVEPSQYHVPHAHNHSPINIQTASVTATASMASTTTVPSIYLGTGTYKY